MPLRRCMNASQNESSDTTSSYTSSSSSSSSYSSSSAITSSKPSTSLTNSPRVTKPHASSHGKSSSIPNLSTSSILRKYQMQVPVGKSAPPNSTMAYEPRRSLSPYVSLGPIIGMVTETTARILIETSEDVEVKCFLTDSHGVQHGTSQLCMQQRPTALVFEELRAGTRYKVSFNIPVPGLVESSFYTLKPNWGSVDVPARIACVSNNNLDVLKQNSTSRLDLWRNLYSQNHKSHFDYLLLLGNIVYVDSSDYIETKIGRQPTEGNDAAFLNALEMVLDSDHQKIDNLENQILEMFRNVYRDTLTNPSVRHCLANIPCLSIPGDMELGVCMDDVSDHKRKFVHACAYRVFNEYFRALFDNMSSPTDNIITISQGYHFHAFGDIAFMFLDTKAYPLFHQSSKTSNEVNFLGARQWSDIDYALSPRGYLSLCRVLVVCTVSPIALSPESQWLQGSIEKKMELLQTWSCEDGVDEASLLLAKLMDWKNQKHREVVLVSGNTVNGGISTIQDGRYSGDARMMKQLVCGPISVKSHTGVASMMNGTLSSSIGVYHKYHHNKIYNSNCYGVMKISRGLMSRTFIEMQLARSFGSGIISPKLEPAKKAYNLEDRDGIKILSSQA